MFRRRRCKGSPNEVTDYPKRIITIDTDPGNENFVAIVLGLLSASYKTYLSALTGAATLLGKTLNPDMVLQGINDKAEQKTM